MLGSGVDPVGKVGASRRLRMWSVVALAVLLIGVVSSVAAAELVAASAADRSRRDFKASAAEVTSTLGLAIQREEDLIISARGFVVGSPHASDASFVRWSESVQALERHPELLGLGQSVVVPSSQLAAFASHHGGRASASGSTFKVTPTGNRPFYCLSTGSVSRSAATAFPPGYDFCAGNIGLVSLAARDSGASAYIPIRNGKSVFLSVLTPIYRGGAVPATLKARRGAFLGWVGMAVLPKIVLARALVGHPQLTVSMQYHGGSSTAVFRSGPIPGGGQTATTSLGNGWRIMIYGAAVAGGVFAGGPPLGVLLVGIALSVLLAVLMFVLATGRARALRVVGEKTEELRHQALHDALTGLPNRALIMDRIERLLARNHRNGTRGAALYVDLDEFKNVNDTLGHEAGDRLLKGVAARLTATLRDADTIGRMGGDEFIILIDGGVLNVAPEMVAERLLEVMRQPFELAESPLPISMSTSIGIAIGDRATPGELLRDADVALYQAKAAGANCYKIFEPAMETSIERRYKLEFDLRSALEQKQFRLLFQPIYNLDDLALIGVEALLRWEHPTLGQIQPEEFIPLLESTGQIVSVGTWVLDEACAQMAAWRERGSDLSVSVNVSGRQLDQDTIIDDVRRALQASGLDPAALTLEVTETVLMRNVDATARRLRELKELGVQLAIDDFGTGYSSLAYLQRFPVDCLKIDRSFTDAISRSPESKALIHTLAQLGKDLGLRTLAEGVETTGQLDHLRDQHFDEVQGFLLAKPLASDAFESQLLHPPRPEPPPTPPTARRTAVSQNTASSESVEPPDIDRAA